MGVEVKEKWKVEWKYDSEVIERMEEGFGVGGVGY